MSQAPRLNRLTGESSPYLRQHASNPVDWYPWGEEALRRAREEGKPIFLSVGYSACHWCHVMERESFENPEIARLMNEFFINIKVDREERPDIDAIYMNAVQLMAGSGGWPMSVFLTPDLRPFYGGTYFPPEDRYGRPGFASVLKGTARAWKERRERIESSAREITEALGSFGQFRTANRLPHSDVVVRGVRELTRIYDRQYGGFGAAPKFPHTMELRLLLRSARRSGDAAILEMVTTTLRAMAEGGIYDQLGGGFHRYSTDERWLVPHFEKMLYDNALLVHAYLEAALLTRDPFFGRVVRETLGFVLREMTHPDGGFYSTLDADSEGEEGKYYVWTRDEIEAALGAADADLFCRAYGVTDGGNFEAGTSVLHVAERCEALAAATGQDAPSVSEALERARARLLEVRSARVRPGLDDKVITSWNGLMIGAMARAGAVLGEPRFTQAASRAAAFVEKHLVVDGRLARTWCDGRARFAGYLDDYAFLADGLLDLYETTFEARWISSARRWLAVVLNLFWDEKDGGFFFTADDHEKLIVRQKDPYDGEIPAGDAVTTGVLIRLFELTGEDHLLERAEKTILANTAGIEQSPRAFCQMLMALDHFTAKRRSIVIAGERDAEATRALVEVVRRQFLPHAVVAWCPAAGPDEKLAQVVPLLAGRVAVHGQATAYVCEGFSCQAPVSTPAELAAVLGE
ncbi:MAG: thioredoxin domain-containing protein [Planctomycetota bacterium]